MTDARDFQRGKAYGAEATVPRGQKLRTMPKIEGFVRLVCQDPWTVATYGKWHVYAKDGRRRRSACASVYPGTYNHLGEPGWRFGEIKMPRCARCERIALHELAHVFTFDACLKEGGHHGPIWTRVYVDLVTRFIGYRAGEALATAFHRDGVKIVPTTSPEFPWRPSADAIPADDPAWNTTIATIDGEPFEMRLLLNHDVVPKVA